MDIFFQDPNDVPLPPDEVRIRSFTATAYPDGRRVRITLEVSPFQKRPSGEISISDADGRLLASANIIETMTRKLELTLHLRGEAPAGEYRAEADLFYQALPPDPENGDAQEYELPERKSVDHRRVSFTIGENQGQ